MNNKDQIKERIKNVLDNIKLQADSILYHFNEYNDKELIDECSDVIDDGKYLKQKVDDLKMECYKISDETRKKVYEKLEVLKKGIYKMLDKKNVCTDEELMDQWWEVDDMIDEVAIVINKADDEMDGITEEDRKKWEEEVEKENAKMSYAECCYVNGQKTFLLKFFEIYGIIYIQLGK